MNKSFTAYYYPWFLGNGRNRFPVYGTELEKGNAAGDGGGMSDNRLLDATR